MIAALARFAAALREGGVRVSPSEMLDASRALDLVGIEARGAVRIALRATLAKDRRAAEVFDAMFDRFFAPPRRGGRGGGEERAGVSGERPRAGAGERVARVPAKPKPGERPQPARPVARVLGREDRRRLDARLEREALTLREHGPIPGQHHASRLRRVLEARRASAREADPLRADLAARMATEEERRIAREVPALVRALRLRPGRRLERARSGRPWLRRILRENLSRGGVPFVIPYRSPRRRRLRVVLLVDVSHSVARAAGFFVLMASEFVALGRRARVLAFVDKPVDVTTPFARWASGRSTRPERASSTARARRASPPGAGIAAGGVTFAEVLEGIPGLNLEAPSDYGRAFHALLTSRHRPKGRGTILVVLGDGRTNRFDPLPWALTELAAGCRSVLWLIPEPVSRWGRDDSALPTYLPSVDLAVEATDLAGLARGIAALIRRL